MNHISIEAKQEATMIQVQESHSNSALRHTVATTNWKKVNNFKKRKKFFNVFRPPYRENCRTSASLQCARRSTQCPRRKSQSWGKTTPANATRKRPPKGRSAEFWMVKTYLVKILFYYTYTVGKCRFLKALINGWVAQNHSLGERTIQKAQNDRRQCGERHLKNKQIFS